MQGRTPIPLKPQTPHTPVSREKESKIDTSTSTTTRARAHAREDVDRVMAYAITGGLPDSDGIRAYVARMIDALSADVVMAALDDTWLAPHPSWRYLMAICRRLQAAGIRTREQWDADAAQFAARRSAAGAGARPRALQCSERQYAPGELDRLLDQSVDEVLKGQAPASRPCKTVGAHRFGQREYTDEELDRLLFSDLDDLTP